MSRLATFNPVVHRARDSGVHRCHQLKALDLHSTWNELPLNGPKTSRNLHFFILLFLAQPVYRILNDPKCSTLKTLNSWFTLNSGYPVGLKYFVTLLTHRVDDAWGRGLSVALADRTATQCDDRLLASSSVCLSVTLCIVALRVGMQG